MTTPANYPKARELLHRGKMSFGVLKLMRRIRRICPVLPPPSAFTGFQFPRVQRFTPLLIDAARPCRHAAGDRWFVDETYVKVSGRWVYLYRVIDQFGQVIDVLISEKRDLGATRALQHGPSPTEVTTDRAPAYPRVLDELLPAACHVTEQYANNPIEADHGRLKSWLRPMRGVKRLRSARVISAGHAFVQNLHRGHYELGLDIDPRHRVPHAFAELASAM